MKNFRQVIICEENTNNPVFNIQSPQYGKLIRLTAVKESSVLRHHNDVIEELSQKPLKHHRNIVPK